MLEVKKLLKVLYCELNYMEKSRQAFLKDPSVLDKKQEGAGADNYTKYGRDMHKISPKNYNNGEYWCDTFTYQCFVKAYGVENTRKLLHGQSAYTPTSANYFKNNGEWHTGYDVEVGDKIFFRNSVRICHTGIVVDVDKKKRLITTIEGNTNNGAAVIPNGGSVCIKKYNIGNPAIAGYGRPKYEKEVVKVDENVRNIGWHTDNIGKWYRYKEGVGPDTYYRNIVKEIDGKCYAFNQNGYVIKKTLSKIGFGEDGHLIVK